MQIKNVFNTMVIGLLMVFGIVGLQQPPVVYAQDASDAVCDALGSTGNACAAGGGEIDSVLAVALNILSVVAGVIAVIMLIISGLKFITSQGDASSISSARSSIIYALVGIIIVALAQVVVRFVINQATTTPAQSQSAPLGRQLLVSRNSYYNTRYSDADI